MPYVKNDPPWVNGGAPGISAERLNHMETQYDEAKADLDAAKVAGHQGGWDADKVDGYHAGNASGSVAVANGVLCTNLNAEKLGGQTAAQLVPPGAIMAFARSTPPSGWLECNGQAVSRTTYAALFAAIGTTFGAGDGSTTFNLPDLRGEFIRGWDHGRGVDANRVFGSAQADELKAHTHTYSAPGVGYNVNAGSQATVIAGTVQQSTGSTGGAETRPRNVALMYCIKY